MKGTQRNGKRKQYHRQTTTSATSYMQRQPHAGA